MFTGYIKVTTPEKLIKLIERNKLYVEDINGKIIPSKFNGKDNLNLFYVKRLLNIFNKGLYREILETEYHIGDKFYYGKSNVIPFMLCRINLKYVALIDLNNGTYFEEGIKPKNIHKITEEEFKELTGNRLELFEPAKNE